MYIIVAALQIKEGFKEQYVKGLIENASSAVRDESGCLRFDVIQDANDDNKLWVYEVYNDEAAFHAHTQLPITSSSGKRALTGESKGNRRAQVGDPPIFGQQIMSGRKRSIYLIETFSFNPNGGTWVMWATMKYKSQYGLALSIIVLLVMMACTTSDREEEPRTGDPAIYERIESLTDCEALQIEFNLARGNLARTRHDDNEGRENYRSYAETAEDRLDELRC